MSASAVLEASPLHCWSIITLSSLRKVNGKYQRIHWPLSDFSGNYSQQQGFPSLMSPLGLGCGVDLSTVHSGFSSQLQIHDWWGLMPSTLSWPRDLCAGPQPRLLLAWRACVGSIPDGEAAWGHISIIKDSHNGRSWQHQTNDTELVSNQELSESWPGSAA